MKMVVMIVVMMMMMMIGNDGDDNDEDAGDDDDNDCNDSDDNDVIIFHQYDCSLFFIINRDSTDIYSVNSIHFHPQVSVSIQLS